MKMQTLLLFVLINFLSCDTEEVSRNTYIPPYQPPVDYLFEDTPIWSDEFDYTGKPDPEKWGYEIGGHGWGNNELQYYTDSLKNARVENGILKITAIKEDINENTYSSTRLVSREKGDFLYGRIVIRAKLPKGRGTWPALWMLPTDWEYGGWPDSGEIDIMEHVGYDQNRVHITVHTEDYNHVKGTQVGKNKVVENVSESFHEYRVDWTPEYIEGFIDDEKIFRFDNEHEGPASWPFDKRFHIIMNIAVGGNWGGVEGVDPEAFPTTMEVDYVRVYALKDE